jgi:hypothetical protein
MRPGTVESDDQAFRQILGRLRGEVGKIIELIGESKTRGGFPDTAPFWALLRMTFPIAESLGDLIYGGKTGVNLQSILANEFDAVRPGYRRIAATLAVLYRHSLTHHDEPRVLLTGGKDIVWYLGFGKREIHLQVIKVFRHNSVDVRFDTTAFYDDLVAVCEGQIGKHSDGKIRDRYNGWLIYDLDATRQKEASRDAIAEIEAL